MTSLKERSLLPSNSPYQVIIVPSELLIPMTKKVFASRTWLLHSVSMLTNTGPEGGHPQGILVMIRKSK